MCLNLMIIPGSYAYWLSCDGSVQEFVWIGAFYSSSSSSQARDILSEVIHDIFKRQGLCIIAEKGNGPLYHETRVAYPNEHWSLENV